MERVVFALLLFTSLALSREVPRPRAEFETRHRDNHNKQRKLADQCGDLPKANQTAMPQYLVIGDSISMGYFNDLKAALNTTLEALHIPVNGGNSARGVACLDTWLGRDPGRWKVISFNFGLHDIAHDQERLTLQQYTDNMHNITARLNATSAKLLWVDTTPVPNATVSPPRSDADVVTYNAAAAKVMEAYSVPTDDLYGWVEAKCGAHYTSCSIQNPKNVHFVPAGYMYLVQSLAPAVKKLLE